jgi:hypothetical protein
MRLMVGSLAEKMGTHSLFEAVLLHPSGLKGTQVSPRLIRANKLFEMSF